MKRILWVSRHPYLPSQLEALRRHFGEVEVTQDPKPFSGVEEILGRYRQGQYDDLVVVAPLSVLGRMVDLGVRPLWAEMLRLPEGERGEVKVGEREFRFVRFRRVRALRLEFDELE